MRKTYRFSELDAAVHGRHEYTDSGALALSWSAPLRIAKSPLPE